MFQEFFSSDFVFINALFFQFLNNLNLCGNGCMICSRLPQGFITLHSLKADKNVLHGLVQGMSHMKLPGYIWRGHYNGKWFLVSVYFCMEIFVIQPLLINPILQPFWIVGFCKFFAHHILLSLLRDKKIPLITIPIVTKGDCYRGTTFIYHSKVL